MNKYSIFTYIVFFIGFTLPAAGQNSYKGEIKYTEIQAKKQKDRLAIRLQMDLSSIELSSQRIVQLTPVIKAENLANEYRGNPVFIVGKTRNQVIARNGKSYSEVNTAPESYIVRKNGKEQVLPMSLNVPFEEWMYNAQLYFEEAISGCAQCDLGENNYLVMNPVIPPKFIPSYELQYITPEAEEVKRRSESYAALLNFRVGKYDLIRDFQNNATILNEVDKVVHDIRNDENLTVQGMFVTGYASPEGNYNSNLVLSKNRTYSFTRYLADAHNIHPSSIKADWKGEDWEGLRKSVAGSTLADRDMVLRIIDNNENITQRKKQLQTLNGGSTYRTLLNEYYPPLRRIEYTFSYIARPFNVEEAKEIIKRKPQHLSLNEMFLVAQTYEKGSKEFDQIFDIAVRLFPESEVAGLNAAVQEINAGAVDKAIERLKAIDFPEAFNNLGIAYIRKGEYESALNCLKKAADSGNEVAKTNMQQLNRFLEDQ